MAVFLSNYVFPTRYIQFGRHPNPRRPNSVTDFDFALYYPLANVVNLEFIFIILINYK